MKSLLKEFTRPDLKNSDSSDAGKSDVIDKAVSSNDVSFSNMRNSINNNSEISGSNITNYLERAKELNDEIDTIPFGLETDNGDIVKVYVNAEQADKFEEAMKKLLGVEDDVEEAINRLAYDFDIVDVVWPKDKSDDGAVQDNDIGFDDLSSLDDLEAADAVYEPLASLPEAKNELSLFKSLIQEEDPIEPQGTSNSTNSNTASIQSPIDKVNATKIQTGAQGFVDGALKICEAFGIPSDVLNRPNVISKMKQMAARESSNAQTRQLMTKLLVELSKVQ